MNRPALALAVLVFLLNCSADECDGYLDLYTCETPDIGHVNTKGEPDPCHKDDAESCSGQCVLIPPAGWDSLPMLVWFGEGLAPDCPADRAGSPAYEGHTDLQGP